MCSSRGSLSNAIIEPVASVCTPQSAPSIVAPASARRRCARRVTRHSPPSVSMPPPPMTYISLLLGPRLLVNVDSSLRPTRFLASFRRLKSSALIYNNMREDLEHIVKYGTSLHGEVFIGGLRVRRANGKPHSEPLPEGFISQKVEGSPQVSSVLDSS